MKNESVYNDFSSFGDGFTLLDKTIEHLKQNEILLNDRKNRYSGVNDYCKEHFMYNKDKDSLHEVGCKCYNCERCRRKKKYDLLKNIVDSAEKHDLRRHLVITLPGYPFRSLFCNADESFDYAMKKFNEFRVLYKRRFGNNLSYICLPRSQSDGFCHLHILVGSYISKDWLDKTLNGINLGFPYITYVDIHRLGNYLSKYWYKEHEWFIPENKKHYTRSADIDFESFIPSGGWHFLVMPNNPYVLGCDKIDYLYRVMDYVNPYHNPPPLHLMLSAFYEDSSISFGNNYIGFLRKYGVRSSGGLTSGKLPAFQKNRQSRLFYDGRSFMIKPEDYVLPKYTKQKKYKCNNPAKEGG